MKLLKEADISRQISERSKLLANKYEQKGKPMTKYRLRYFFDHASGDCLWSGNEAASTRFGYPVLLDELGISSSTQAFAQELFEIVVSDRIWRNEDVRVSFLKCAHAALLELLREELGSEFEILDES